jgi:hypothetical protein
LIVLGKGVMGENYNKFVDLHRDGKLVDPQDCGYALASLSINASKDLSGKYVSWDDEELAEYRRKN